MLYSSKSGDYIDFVMNNNAAILLQKNSEKLSAEQREYAKAVVLSQNENSNILKYSIDNQTYEILASKDAMAQAFRDSFSAVSNTLTIGLKRIDNTLSSGFNNVNYNLSFGISNVNQALYRIFDGMVINFSQIKISIDKMSSDICDRLDKIQDTLSNPRRIQSQEFYRRAVSSTKRGLFEEALEDLNNSIENEKTNYYSWYLKGLLELYGYGRYGNTINPTNAVESLNATSKYFFAELGTSSYTVSSYADMAADICYQLAWAEYVCSNDLRLNGKTQEANLLLEKAMGHYRKSARHNDKYDSEYQIARCQYLLGNEDVALATLKKYAADYETKHYIFKALMDPDFYELRERLMKVIDDIRKVKYAEAVKLKNVFVEKCAKKEIIFREQNYKEKEIYKYISEKELPENLPLLDCFDFISYCQENSKKAYYVGISGKELKQAYNEAVKARENFLKKYGDLCFYKGSYEPERLRKIKEEEIPCGLLVASEYKELAEKYKAEAKRYENYPKSLVYITIPKKQLINELGLFYGEFEKEKDVPKKLKQDLGLPKSLVKFNFSIVEDGIDSDTAKKYCHVYFLYSYNNQKQGFVFKKSPKEPDKPRSIYFIGVPTYYTFQNEIIPCFVVGKEYESKTFDNLEEFKKSSPETYQPILDGRPLYDTQGCNIAFFVPDCAKPKERPQGARKIICGIEQFSEFENKVPLYLTKEYYES